MNTISLNLTITDDLYARLNSFVKELEKGSSNEFIVEAIEQKLKSEKQQLRLELKEGYQATKLEDMTLVKEFEFADYEKIQP